MSSAATRPAGPHKRKKPNSNNQRVKQGDPLEWQVFAVPRHHLLIFTAELHIKTHDGQQMNLESEIFDRKHAPAWTPAMEMALKQVCCNFVIGTPAINVELLCWTPLDCDAGRYSALCLSARVLHYETCVCHCRVHNIPQLYRGISTSPLQA